MRTLLFYLFAAVIAAGLILASLGPRLFAGAPGPVTGHAENTDWRVFAPQELARAQAGPGAHIYVAHEEGAPAALRLVLPAGAGAPTAQSVGVRLALAPEAVTALGQGPFEAMLELGALGATNAQTLRLGVFDGARTQWTEPQPLPAEGGFLTFTLPATAGERKAIAFWPQAANDEYDYGIELRALRLRPARVAPGGGAL